jgi:hypothetical protein
MEFCNTVNGQVGHIDINSNTTTYATGPSDYRLKENIETLSGGLASVQAMRPVSFTWKNGGERAVGFIAHELQEIVPSSVTGQKDAVDEDGNPKYQSLFPAPAEMIAKLVSAIQELKAINDTQAETINALTARITALENA